MPELAGPPPGSMSIPSGLRTALATEGFPDAELRPVWVNAAGGLTCAIVPGGADNSIEFYAKWNPRFSGESLSDEVKRMDWLGGRHPVPEPVFYTADDHQEVMVTQALKATSAVSPRWINDPHTALRALGEGLRRLHELPVKDCPFAWSVAGRLAEHSLPPQAVGTAPEIDRLVICQGDPCAPNTLLDDEGEFAAHVDLARLGAADRWADLAVMTMSLGWNYTGYDETVFWQAYGVDPDPVRIQYYQYYRELWNVT